eukprot:TRINITY_DN11265_c0_g1_i17.p2 TRINITY_DN11265_c0_g1~~TRINITY_DN11265_c0_g1_i17.p2  ORF type:complete len:148 (-),score=11.99 TRINITY_DN11265_c0_g1_i17:200-643(-)
MPLKDASRILNINYNSAKTIMNVYKKQGRINKKLTRRRKPKNSNKHCIPLTKKIFHIQKIEVESLTEQLSTESLKETKKDVRPQFSFSLYSRRIMDEYSTHLRKRGLEVAGSNFLMPLIKDKNTEWELMLSKKKFLKLYLRKYYTQS